MHRHFTAEFTNWVPTFANISCNVPQDSILGPLLFLIYVNDMSQDEVSELYLYADKEVTEI